MSVYSPIIEIVIIPDNLFHESLSFDDMVAMFYEIREYEEFCFGDLDTLS